jgi:hypothetical protein
MYNYFPTPESALENILAEGEKSYLGSKSVWFVHRNAAGGKVSGARRITRNTLKDRVYLVSWCNDSVAIEFLDAVWLDIITGRSYPEATRCQVVHFPTNEAKP